MAFWPFSRDFDTTKGLWKGKDGPREVAKQPPRRAKPPPLVSWIGPTRRPSYLTRKMKILTFLPLLKAMGWPKAGMGWLKAGMGWPNAGTGWPKAITEWPKAVMKSWDSSLDGLWAISRRGKFLRFGHC